MDAASLSTRSNSMGVRFLFDLSSRKLAPILAISNRHSQTMEAKPGRPTGSRTIHALRENQPGLRALSMPRRSAFRTQPKWYFEWPKKWLYTNTTAWPILESVAKRYAIA